MANGYMNQFSYSYEKAKCLIFGRVTIGASGAPTLDAPNSKGIKSIVRNSAGNYTITLKESFYRFFGLDARFLIASGLPASPTVAVCSQAVNSSTAPTIVIQCSAAGVATDPASGEELDLVIMLKNTSAI